MVQNTQARGPYKYDVYGMGNALVDMEFEIETEFLKKMDILKGQMTLVDEQRQKELIEALHGLRHKRACGGSAANTVIAVAQMGGRSFYSCKVANDELGDFYFKDLQEQGVKTNLFGPRPQGITGKCLVMITPDADRTMNTFLGITSEFSHQELCLDDLKQSEYLYIEGYLVASPTALEAVLKARAWAKEHGVKMALTFSDISMVSYFREGMEKFLGAGEGDLPACDLLFCNLDEALTFTQTKTVEEAAKALKKWSKAFAITMGPKGAFIYDGEKEIDIITAKVAAVDTNGAGDLFAGSYLYALTHGYSHGQAGRLACSAASELVTQFGPRLKAQRALEIRKAMLD